MVFTPSTRRLIQRGRAVCRTRLTIDLRTGDENKDVTNPAPQLQLSARLIDAAELPPRLMLETQAKRLGLRVLPDATASALRAYLLRCGARPVCEEYFVDDVYRTAFDKDDYSTVQLEVLIN